MQCNAMHPNLFSTQQTHKHIPLASSTIIIVQSVDTHNIKAQAMKRINDFSGKCDFLSRRNIFSLIFENKTKLYFNLDQFLYLVKLYKYECLFIFLNFPNPLSDRLFLSHLILDACTN